ncbi:DUF262 domain-containing protein [Bacillus stercoris]|uniref:DUF262 domain-containing protein n=1 Tax=Bacillus stercoris TaxID=2054641 RepID=UPI003CF895BE
MRTTKPDWSNRALARMYSNKQLRDDYPIQRARGLWDHLQKSLLIHSIAGNYPIPPIAIVHAELDGVKADFIIDGNQRVSTIIDFLSGVKDKNGNYPDSAFPLHEETPEVYLEGSDKPYELAGKYFDELDEDVQSDIESKSIQIQRIEDATDEEIEELFARWNNGTPLSKQQKARGLMGTKNSILLGRLQKHHFMQNVARFTKLQRRRSDDDAVILQTMMLLMEDEIEFKSFVANNILEFAHELRNRDIADIAKEIEGFMEYLEKTEASSPLFKRRDLPTLFMVVKKAIEEGVEPEAFGAWLEDFNNAITVRLRDKAIVKTRYKDFTSAGSVKKKNVMGRKKEMLKHFDEFIKQFDGATANQEVAVSKEEPMWTDDDIKEDEKGKKKKDNKKPVKA